MSRPRALDLFCCAGGISTGLARAGFDVTAVDINPQPHHRGGTFVQADALAALRDRAFLRQFDFIHASPPCQRYSTLRHLSKDRGERHPDHIAEVLFLLERSGVPWSIENVPGSPLGGRGRNLTLLCGTMFGLGTADGRAELRRHRWFETSWPIALRPMCQHGSSPIVVTGHSYQTKLSHSRRRAALSVSGTGLDHNADRHRRRRAISVIGNQSYTNTVRNQERELFTVEDARVAMGIDWPMPMKYLSQAIPPPYGEWLGRQALLEIAARRAA